MALNKFMHPRNIYKNKPLSAKTLKGFTDDLDKLINEEGDGFRLDFSSPKHLCALTKALLKQDFDLDIELSPERLIPTVPLRLNYILWLEDVIQMNPGTFGDVPTLFDIGIGPSCIYPVLGCKKNGWKFYGSEIDPVSFHFAQENVKRNNLGDKIQIHLTDNKEDFFTDFFTANPTASLDIVMSNPPFYANQSEAIGAETTRTDRRPKATSFSTAARHESQTVGGEVYFSFKLAKESIKYKDRIKLVTVMLGKKSSVKSIKKMLDKLKIKSYSVYEFCQGRVMRWGLAWSPDSVIKFPVSEFRLKRKLFKPMKMEIPRENNFLTSYSYETILGWLGNELRQLEMKVLEQKNKSSIGGYHFFVKAYRNTWIHSRKKRRQALQQNKEKMEIETQSEEKDYEPEFKRKRLTEEQVEESSAWDESFTNPDEKPILNMKIYVKGDIDSVANEESSDTEEDEPAEGTKEPKEDQPTNVQYSARFHLIDSDNSKDLINQLILYLRNRMK